MDLINSFLDLVLPPIGIISLLFILPMYVFFKFASFTLRSMFSENVAGKVVLITGASSGIGEHLAYEYGSRGACLALVARREDRLREVAGTARLLGSPEVMIFRADVSNDNDCKRFVDLTVDHFGRLDHLVTNAGVAPVCLFEEITDITKLRGAMEINFWGSVYTTYYAIPYLRQTAGKIIAIASSAGWLPAPRLSLYSASKAAVTSLYETLRTEVGSAIGITIVTPGLIESEMTQGKFMSKEGDMVLDQELRDVEVSLLPIRKVTEAAKAIVNGACRGDRYLTEPGWIRTSFYWKVFCPEVLEWTNRLLLLSSPGNSGRDTLSKKLYDRTGLQEYRYPETVREPELKSR